MKIDIDPEALKTPEYQRLIRAGVLTIDEPEVRGPCVYIMGAKSGAAPRKIGITADLKKRRTHLQNANGRRILVLFVHPMPDMAQAKTVERKAHAALAKYRLEGEWFRAPLELLRAAVVDALPPLTPRPLRRGPAQ